MRALRRLLVPVLIELAALAVSSTSSAGDPPEDEGLHWDDRWARFRPVELVLTGEAGPAAIAEYWLAPPQPRPRWTQGNPLDDSVRNALRLRSPGALRIAWTLADAVDVSLIALVVGVDSLAVPLFRGSADVGLQLLLMDGESFALSSIVTITLYDNVGRARPSYADCQRDPSFEAECRTSPTASFPSGHVNEAFTTAGLSCAHHTMLPLYGSRPGDALACARDLTLATADGVLRMMGDRHYATDVLAGSAIGFAFGYGLPMLLHYTSRAGSDSGAPAWSLAPLAAGRLGLAVVGTL